MSEISRNKIVNFAVCSNKGLEILQNAVIICTNLLRFRAQCACISLVLDCACAKNLVLRTRS
jgi:hypothetical protein